MTDEAFRKISGIAYREAGLAISPAKAAMVHTRVARRLRALNIASYDEYCSLIESVNGRSERRELISVLTTNVSSFFRENHHFDRLHSEILPELRAKLENRGRIRIWSAGCSNGQEPYSIAMTLLRDPYFRGPTDTKILATDIDPKVIRFARRGCYDGSMISGLSEEMKTTGFDLQPGNPGDGANQWCVRDKLRELIAFRELNLLNDWPMTGKFDVIFCRNVVIYFDEETQKKLWQKFADALRPGGWLFLGHSERVADESLAELVPVGMTTYRRAPIPASPKDDDPGKD